MKTIDTREIAQSLELLERSLATRSPSLSPRIQTGLRAGAPADGISPPPPFQPLYGVGRPAPQPLYGVGRGLPLEQP